MSSLCIPSRLCGDGPSGAWIHGIIVFFMNLNIFSKFSADVLVVVDLYSGNEFAGVDIS